MCVELNHPLRGQKPHLTKCMLASFLRQYSTKGRICPMGLIICFRFAFLFNISLSRLLNSHLLKDKVKSCAALPPQELAQGLALGSA